MVKKFIRALLVAGMALGFSSGVSAQEQKPAEVPQCTVSAVNQAYWYNVYVNAVFHGLEALDQKNLDEVLRSDELANFAMENSCSRGPLDEHVKLKDGKMLLLIDREVSSARELIVQQAFEGALSRLDYAKDRMEKNNIAMSDEFRTLVQKAAEGTNSDYMVNAEAHLAKGEHANALRYVRAVVRTVKKYGVTPPARLAEVGQQAATGVVALRAQEVKKLVDENDFDSALQYIDDAKRTAKEYGVALPAELVAAEARTQQGRVDAYFAKLDATLNAKKISQSEFNTNEGHACKIITTMPIPLPERCTKHVETKRQ